MPILIDREGNRVQVAPEHVQQALQAGLTVPTTEGNVVIRSPTGRVFRGPAEDLPEALSRGFRLEEPEEAKERELQEQYGGTAEQVGTFIHGAANALSFGAVDAVGSAVSDDYKETVRKLKEANPDAELGGEMTGLIGSFLVPGGQTSAIAKATKLPRGVAKIGRTVEQATLKALGGTKGGMVRQALAKGTAMGAGAGTEGAIYGAGQWLSEASLGETEATAENLIAHMKMGALWGGAAGVSLGSGGELLRRGLGQGKRFAKRSAKSIARMFEKGEGRKLLPDAMDALEHQIANPNVGAYSKTVGKVLGVEPESIARGIQGGKAGRVFRERATESIRKRENYVRELADGFDLMDDITALGDDAMRGKEKIRNMGSIKEVGNSLEAAKDAGGIIDDALDSVNGYIESGDYIGVSANRLKKMKYALERHKKRLDEVLLKENIDDAGEKIHGTIDSLKRDFGKIREKTKPGAGTSEIDDIASELENRYQIMQKHLEETKFYGKVGDMQRRYNAPWSADIGSGKTAMARKIREKVGEAAWRPVYETSRGGIENVVNDLGRARNMHMEEFLENRINNRIERIKAAREFFEDVPEKTKKMWDEAEAVANRLKSKLAEAKKVVGAQNQLDEIAKRSSLMSGVLPMGAGVGVGYLFGGEEGAALGLGLSVFTNPGRLIQMRAALDRLSTSKEIGVVKAIKSYISKAKGKDLVRKMIAPASLTILERSNWGERRTRDKSRRQAYERRTEELTEFLTQPEKTLAKIDKTLASVSEVAPNVAAQMKLRAVKAARYLYDRAPKPGSEQLLLEDKWRPSEVDLAKFERIAAVIDDPANALKSLRAGCLTVEEVDALKENYPRMYEKVVTTIAEQIPELRGKLPYRERVQLSVLFDVPVDATMEDNFLMAMQTVGAAAQMPMQPPQTRPQKDTKLGDFSKSTVDTATMTSAQAIEQRKLTA